MSEISVVVNGASSINPTVGNGDTVAVTISETGERGPTGDAGPAGPANTLSIGTVTGGATAAATITGAAPNQTLNLTLPQGATGSAGAAGSQGPTGPACSLTIGTVSKGSTAAATITGTAPNQTLSLTLPQGDTGPQGPAGAQGPAGTANLSDETPQALGTASAGTALSAARADHVHAVPTISYTNLTNVPATFIPAAHTQGIATITGLQAALDGMQPAGTYATLVGGTVPSAQLPSYVDDVIEAANLAAFAATGDVGKIYVARDTGKIYRWSGSAYIEISPSPGSTDAVPEGSLNLYFTNTRAANAAPVQSVAGRTGTVTLAAGDVGLGNVDNTSDANKPISTATQTALDGKAASSHAHGNVTSAGAIGSTSGLIVVTTTAGALTTATIGSGLALSGGTLTASGGGGGGGSVDGGEYV